MSASGARFATVPYDAAQSGLPAGVRKAATGVMVDLAALAHDGSLAQFVHRLFAAGARFVDLDYALFLNLLYHRERLATIKGSVRLASDIVVFAPQRQALYREVRLTEKDTRAQYLFEPIFMEVAYQEALVDNSVPGGAGQILGYEERTRTEPTQLDFDELVAALWMRGVRYGILVKEAQAAIATVRAGRVDVAAECPATPGRDAELHEEFDGLHRDNSPLISGGKADLRRFKNRFPQVKAQQRLLRKVPMRAGIPGVRLSGEPIAATPPKDLELAKLAGAGTTVIRVGEDEYIVAAADGFVDIDQSTNQISVNTRIENREGISTRTTGDLSLTVDEYIEGGEVQEGRTVDGLHMTFKATVFGHIISRGGRVALLENLSGGSAESPGGSVHIAGRAFNARIEAPGGEVRVAYAEKAVIIADSIHIEQAIHCTLLGHHVDARKLRSCSVLGKSLAIGLVERSRGEPSTLWMQLPDDARAQRKRGEIQAAIAPLEQLIQDRTQKIRHKEAEPEVHRYLTLLTLVREGKITLTPTQESTFKSLQAHQLPTIDQLQKWRQERSQAQKTLEVQRTALEQLEHEQVQRLSGTRCQIDHIEGETRVQRLSTDLGLETHCGVPANDLHLWLQHHTTAQPTLFAADRGSFAWDAAAPAA